MSMSSRACATRERAASTVKSEGSAPASLRTARAEYFQAACHAARERIPHTASCAWAKGDVEDGENPQTTVKVPMEDVLPPPRLLSRSLSAVRFYGKPSPLFTKSRHFAKCISRKEEKEVVIYSVHRRTCTRIRGWTTTTVGRGHRLTRMLANIFLTL